MNPYQPPATLSNFSPQLKYPKLPPVSYTMTYGQTGTNQTLNFGQANHDFFQQKLALKQEIQAKDDSLNGVFGWLCRIWFSIMIILSIVFLIAAVDTLNHTYQMEGFDGFSRRKDTICFAFFCLWLIFQSYMTAFNVSKKDVVKAKKHWTALIWFGILYLILIIGTVKWQLEASTFFAVGLLYGIPMTGNVIFTVTLKNLLEQREKIVQKFEALSNA